ncbi:hypothetical protein COW94_00035 [Candidatus Peregrinibacteria bacterium CG22_combo_CG10-13_8_21_14_all_44_10]|nr:MAG: hypothetical protein AUK45_03490 [Candidatus Peregrinibacteria bacterium CG2_30_44_17]PIP66762.1 MAG: hypothetical protein COW94_00035 [Candidatus Peregrinibacteria bacterium CG22_combo_CG10-13_8_21_14_all_44_10]PIS04007.1 MAG: hypothetical protein COT83_02895 [Candidatus Peregrinibacteria bacterium CG10_big_fil_rev_8_21_14_0_10_44_7]PIX80377.1 MAG: hypothetical protein COZ35_00960 [Candidatus Peregrinibacteria bacterium CG_4_10_14_3_um_filter_44_21]
MDYVGILALIGIGVLIYVSITRKQTPEDTKLIEEKDKQIGELEAQLRAETTRKDELGGKNKIQFAQIAKLEAANDELGKKVARYEAEESKQRRELEHKIDKLDASQKALEDEKARIRREDAEREEQELKERDRMWAEHEEKVIRYMAELCAAPELSFDSYTNTNLPDGFDGKLKPDFMIGFLDQFVVFDAKVSRSDNFQNYIINSVKSTAKKIKGHNEIYNAVFLVVPTEAISELKKLTYYEDGYSFFIISIEAVAPILASLKKIQNYEFAETMDPQERENIISLIAEFDHYINFRSAMDIALAKHGVGTMNRKSKLPQELQDDVLLREKQMRIVKVNETDLKPLMISTERQQREIEQLETPKPQIKQSDIKSAESILE